MFEKSFFYQIWGVVNFGFRRSEAPKRPILEPTPMRPHSGPFLGPFAGVKLWCSEKKNWPTFGPAESPYVPYVHFFNEKIFFCAGLFFSCLEQPKRPPKAPGLASVAAAVLWQHSFHCRPPTAPPARRSWEALVHWCGSVHTAHRPAVGRVLCPGVLPGPI